MPATAASRARADLLRDRIASLRAAHGRAAALAQVNNTVPPPESHLGALGVADHFPALVAGQTAERNMLGAVQVLLTLVEHELARMSG